MMMNMFSIFDPKTNLLPMNVIFINYILFMNFKFWKNNNTINLFMYNYNKTTNLYFLSMKMMIFYINFMNIIPMILSMSNNIMFTINMTMNLWMMMNILCMMNNFNILFMNLSPKMTILNIILIINLIEFNSMLFMILSLSMRLMINMMMGHIIIFMIKMKYLIYIYMLIEMMIIFIQTYVFFILNLINFNNMK